MIWIMSEGFIEQLIEMADGRRTLAQGTRLFHQDDRVRTVFARWQTIEGRATTPSQW